MNDKDFALLRRGLVLVARELVQEAQHPDTTLEEFSERDAMLSHCADLDRRLEGELLA